MCTPFLLGTSGLGASGDAGEDVKGFMAQHLTVRWVRRLEAVGGGIHDLEKIYKVAIEARMLLGVWQG